MTKKKELFTYVSGGEEEIKLSDLEVELMSRIKKAKLSPGEAEKVIKNFKQINPKRYKTKKIDFGDKHVKFAVFADAHMGHSCYRPDVFRKMIKDGKRQDVDFYLNCGDTIEGMSGRDGHIYELTHLGATEQMNYFSEEFSKFDRPVHSIEADSSHGGWFKSKGNTGLDIGEELEAKCENYDFIGYDEQDIELDNGLKVRLRHPGGGTAYALCVDDKTEILTDDGWKFFKNINKNRDWVATLNPKTFQFEWQKPKKFIEQDINGEMIHFKARSFDLMVTPNHKMFVRQNPKFVGRKKELIMPQKSHRRLDLNWGFIEAKDLNGYRQKWQMIRNSHGFKHPRLPQQDINRIKLYAWYITEGCCHKNGKQIIITQCNIVNPENYEEIISVLNNLKIKFGCYGKNKKDITISNKKLTSEFCNRFGRISKEKRIPYFLKNLPLEQLKIFLETLIKGDGWETKNSFGYKSYSQQLLDDVQEIAIKCGYGATKGKDSISISKIQNLPTINEAPKKVNYSGKVYCVTVPNHTILVRRNGRAIWTGNSYKMQKYIESIGGGDKPNILFQGHFHKATQLFYRNIHGFDAGTLCNQTPFMKKIGTPAHVGYWILDVTQHKVKSKGVERVNSQLIPFYD